MSPSFSDKSLIFRPCDPNMLCGISSRFQLLSPSERQVAHTLLTRPPLTRGASSSRPFDLHVLGTPPAFILSQDQTLNKLYLIIHTGCLTQSIQAYLLSIEIFVLSVSQHLNPFLVLILLKLFLTLFNFQGTFSRSRLSTTA